MQLYRANVVRDRFRAAAGAVDEKTLGKIMVFSNSWSKL